MHPSPADPAGRAQILAAQSNHTRKPWQCLSNVWQSHFAAHGVYNRTTNKVAA